MGVYDYACMRCPNCSEHMNTQICVVSDNYCMTYWDLNNPESLAERLNLDELKRLRVLVEDEEFWCDSCKTGPHYFGKNNKEARLELAKELFSTE